MSNEKLFTADEICKELHITIYTLRNWYSWEKKRIRAGEKSYLPQAIRLEHTKGKPRVWDANMLEQLKEYQKTIVTGRNGIYGVYSNPFHKETKKYKKSLKTVENS